MRVVKIRDGDDPMIDPEIGLNVKQHHHRRANKLAGVPKTVCLDSDANIGHDDQVRLLGPEERAPGVEMAVAQESFRWLLLSQTTF